MSGKRMELANFLLPLPDSMSHAETVLISTKYQKQLETKEASKQGEAPRIE